MDTKVGTVMAIIFALGSALGGSDVLCILFDSAGQSPILDVANCAFLFFVLAAFVLGQLLLCRYVRTAGRGMPIPSDAQAPAPTASPVTVPAAECHARATWTVALVAALLGTGLLLNLTYGANGTSAAPLQTSASW